MASTSDDEDRVCADAWSTLVGVSACTECAAGMVIAVVGGGGCCCDCTVGDICMGNPSESVGEDSAVAGPANANRSLLAL